MLSPRWLVASVLLALVAAFWFDGRGYEAEAQSMPTLDPDPAILNPAALTNQQFTVNASTTVQNVNITETEGDGRLTLSASRSGLDCDSDTDSLSLAAGATFWTRFCTVGTTTLAIADAANASEVTSYEIAIGTANTAPSFDAAAYTRTIAENSPATKAVGAPVSAADSHSITYSLTGTDASLFDVDGSGQISVGVGTALDYETKPSYSLNVRATDEHDLSSEVGVTISVTNVNESPTFGQQTYTASVSESVAVGHDVITVTATDPDSGDSIRYSLSGDNRFTINSTSGLVEVSGALDYEASTTHTLTLSATDSGRLSSSATLTITVTNANESPTFGKPTYIASVSESVAVGHDVITVTATDPDSGDSIRYSLSGDNRFTINSTSGLVEVSRALDYENASSHTVTVTARDRVGLTASAMLNIKVTDVDDDPVTLAALSVGRINSTGATLNVTLTNPHTQAATVYTRYRTPAASGSWTAGPSASTTGVSVTFTLTGLNRGADYRIQASLTRDFVTTQRADFSTLASSPPDFGVTAVTRAVDERAPAGTNVGAPVSATDPDGDSITYRLSGDDAASFTIDGRTGQLTVGRWVTLDFETKRTYLVVVTATDSNQISATVSVTINVNDLYEAGLLGTVALTTGRGSGAASERYGYVAGSYGALVSGGFPPALFEDDTARSVRAIYETADGDWVLEYGNGAADKWLNDSGELDSIVVTVRYHAADGTLTGVDTRSFVLGGFVKSTGSDNRLILGPPIPSRDWNSETGRRITIEFHARSAQMPTSNPPASLTNPVGDPGSFIDFLDRTTPGGPVTFQTMVTIAVFAMFLYKTPSTPRGVIMSAIVLILTPWGPVLIGYGDTIAATIIFINVGAGAYAYQAFAARGAT